MIFDYQKYLPTILKIFIAIVILLAIYYIVPTLFIVLLPFIVATIFAMIIEPQVKFMQKKFKLGRRLSSFIALIFSLIIFGILLSLIIYKIVFELVSLSNAIPIYFENFDFNNEINYFTSIFQSLYAKIPWHIAYFTNIPTDTANLITTKINETVNTLSGYITGFISSTLSFILGFIKMLPETLVFLIITIISTYFISSDKVRIKNFIFKQVPGNTAKQIQGLKNDLVFAFIGFIKAQIIILMISATLATIGLTILGIEYALVLGILIGLSELIPVLGTSTIFIPWIIYQLFSGNIFLAIGLLALFLIGVITRQIMEPKILGDQIGLHPLVTLIAVYVGLKIFGVFGMILGPIIIITLRSLNKSKIINIWKE